MLVLQQGLFGLISSTTPVCTAIAEISMDITLITKVFFQWLNAILTMLDLVKKWPIIKKFGPSKDLFIDGIDSWSTQKPHD